MVSRPASDPARGMQAALAGMGVNAALVVVKLLAGIVGHSYALVADAIESSTDIFSSLIVWAGLRITTRPADDDYPYGYGKAETLAVAVVSLMLLGSALGIAVAAVNEILTPHHAPAPFTLAVIAVVIVVKEALSRTLLHLGAETGSPAVKADAWHHRSDAISSAAAFVGISVALWGGHGWEQADDWAALVAAAIIAFNGVRMLRPAVHDLMDRMPAGPGVAQITAVAESVEGVLAVEKLRVRRLGTEYYVDLHVQAEPTLPLRDAHNLSGKVKGAIRAEVPGVAGVLIHMEPYEGDGSEADGSVRDQGPEE
jgi:cation diffusion facilitator family transporter